MGDVAKPDHPEQYAKKKNGMLKRAPGRGNLVADQARGTVTLAGGPSVVSDTIRGDGEVVAAGTTVVHDAVTSTDGVVQELHTGDLRLLTIIKDGAAPDRFTYTFPGSILTPQEDGSVYVDAPGDDHDGVIEPAWAVDANGAAVPTRYEVDMDTLESLDQVVQHAGAAYPVTADPSWRFITGWNGWFGGRFFEAQANKYMTGQIARGGSIVGVASGLIAFAGPGAPIKSVTTFVAVFGGVVYVHAESAQMFNMCVAYRWYPWVVGTRFGRLYALYQRSGTGNCY